MMYRLDLWQNGSPAPAEAFVSILADHVYEPHELHHNGVYV